jgi:hypothetical protein
MVSLFRRNKQPTYQEQVDTSVRGDIRGSTIKEGLLHTEDINMTLVQMAIDDECILELFNPESPMYCELYKPVFAMCARTMFLSNITESQARSESLHFSTMISELQHHAKTEDEYMTGESLKHWFRTRINDSVGGFKMHVLSEDIRRIQIAGLENEKKGFLRKLTGT